MGNWDHLLVRSNRFADDAVVAMERFQEKLRVLSDAIDKRNENNCKNSGDAGLPSSSHTPPPGGGRRRFPMQAFNPVLMESSVSV